MIINNIDVSECEYLTETRHCKAHMAVMGTDANKCKCFPNCYYKQLVREKQALDEIRKYCAYMRAFNECNKTNKGLDVDEVLDIINKTKEIK